MRDSEEKVVTRDVNECLGGDTPTVQRINQELAGYQVSLTVDGFTGQELQTLRNRGYKVTVNLAEKSLKLVPSERKRSTLRE